MYARKETTYRLHLARYKTVVFTVNVKSVLRHDSNRAKASKYLFCTRRRVEVTLVEYRRAHDDKQQAQQWSRQENKAQRIQAIKRVAGSGSATQKDGRVLT